MSAKSPEKLLAKLERATDWMRWFRWLEVFGGDILTIDGITKVSGRVKGRFYFAKGKSLSDAMRDLDGQLAEVERRERERTALKRLLEKCDAS